jgi:hypothetical protein
MSETIEVDQPSEDKKSEMKNAILRMRKSKVPTSSKGKEEEEETFHERPNETLQRLQVLAQRRMHPKQKEEEEEKKPCGGCAGNQGTILVTVLAAASAVVLAFKLYRWMYPSISNEAQSLD